MENAFFQQWNAQEEEQLWLRKGNWRCKETNIHLGRDLTECQVISDTIKKVFVLKQQEDEFYMLDIKNKY